MRRILLVAGSVFFAQNLLAQGATTVIHAGRVLDGRGGTLRDVTIVVEGSKITRVDMSPAKRRAADYELGTLTVLPGLIDSHAHLAWYFNRAGKLHTPNDGDSPAQSILAAAGNAYTTLLAGFTTVQSPGSFEDKDLRDAIASGAIPGPRVLTSLEPLEDPTLSPDSLRKLVRERKKQGADFIKIFASKSIRQGGAATMTVEQMEAMCSEARAQGLRTLVHAHSTESIERSIRAGCTQIEHGLFATDAVLKEMAQRGTIFDPQCRLIFQNYLDNRPKFDGIGNFNAAGFTAMENAIPVARTTFQHAIATPNLKIVFGTDAVAGAHGRNAEDLVCRVKEGKQPPMKTIISATSAAAEALGLGKTIGSIAPGYQADIIAVEGNPSTDITALQRVRFVMKEGRVYTVLPRK
jgi:imidazolonepropionase-like amidohydrolase